MSGPTGLRRFVAGAPTAPGTPASPAAADQPALPIPGPGNTARTADTPETEKCEMCGAAVPAEHSHVADLERSALLCTCRACYLLFTHSGAGLARSPAEPETDPGPAQPRATIRGRYRAVPDRYLHDPPRPMTATEWDELEIPVGLAFFLHSSQHDEVTGFYPSPAGVTECRLDLTAWERIATAHPLLREMEDDVEAALICRTDDGIEHFLVPVDICYELAGQMRLTWRGFDGGTEARQAIAKFLDGVRSRVRPLGKER